MSIAAATRMKHDFRSFLGVAAGNAELLLESTPLTPKQHKYAQRIAQACHDMTSILDRQPADDSPRQAEP